MGYRSEVVLIVGKEVMPQFLTTLAKCPEARNLCFRDTNMRIRDFQGDGNILFNWTYVKWDNDYDPVESLDDFMDWCDGEYSADEHYRFILLGDETDDNVIRGYGFDDVCIERSISF